MIRCGSLTFSQRIPQALNSLPLQRLPSSQPTLFRHKLRARIRPRRCRRRWVSPAHRNSLLHTQRQETRRRSTRPKDTKFLPDRRRKRTMSSTCQLRAARLCLHRSKRQEMGSCTYDRKPCATTTLRQRAREYSTRGRKRWGKRGTRCELLDVPVWPFADWKSGAGIKESTRVSRTAAKSNGYLACSA